MIRNLMDCAEIAICSLITHIEAKVAIHTGDPGRGMLGSGEVLHGVLMAVLTQS